MGVRLRKSIDFDTESRELRPVRPPAASIHQHQRLLDRRLQTVTASLARNVNDCSGQGEMERRASSVIGCGPQTPTMRFHDGTADR
jgi:hypothetical protein